MDELTRIRSAYQGRQEDRRLQGRYSQFDAAHLFLLQSRERQLLRLLKKHKRHQLGPYTILDLGCGHGGELLNLIGYGARPRQTFGLDLLPDRLKQAQNRHGQFGLAQADGRHLPFAACQFDLVFQFTLFTSILDLNFKQQLAGEMLRVLKPGGAIIWYDFWADNPYNLDVKGIKPAEIKALFPSCTFDFQRLTLAPPLARRIVPISWLLAELLARIPCLLSHYLVLIQKS